MTILQFQKTILDWYKVNKRNLPWRQTRNPYKILVSEIMLHQTQISRVIPKYEEFLKEFPSLNALLQTSEKKLLSVWQGLGYWRRALYLKQTAITINDKYNGKFLKDVNVLETLPGIGTYTSRALASFAFNSADAFIDTNIRRVYLHFFFQNKSNVSDKEVLKIAQKAVLKENPREWHYALFDYGAGVLKNKTINKQSKHYAKQSKFEDSFRSFRTTVIQFLLQQPNITTENSLNSFLTKELEIKKAPYGIQEIIASLLKDQIIKKSKAGYHL